MFINKNSKCLNNYSKSEINRYFGESEESIKNCNKCSNFTYENGTITCKLAEGEENDY